MGPWKRACGQISESRIGGSPHFSGSEPFLPISIEAIHNELFNYLHSLRPSTADYPLAIRVKFREPFFPSNAGRRYRLGNLKGEHWRWTWLLILMLAYFQHTANNFPRHTTNTPPSAGEKETSERFLGQCMRYITPYASEYFVSSPFLCYGGHRVYQDR